MEKSDKKKACQKNRKPFTLAAYLFRVSSAVEQWTVNPLVASSNLAPGDSLVDVTLQVS